MQKGDKRIINAWAFYDWANSVYPLVITTAIFPIFYENLTSETLVFLGRKFINTELYSYVISLSFLVVSVMSPVLSGIADYSGNKKRFLQFFCYLGSFSCASLFFFDTDYLWLGLISIFFASIGFWGSLVFYNAYLPEIAEPKDHDRISAKGFSLGYIGSAILLIFCLAMIMVFDVPAKYSFILTGLWWAGFSQITYRRLPNNVYGRKPKQGRIIYKGFAELKKVWKELKKTRRLKRFLASYFVYSMGVQTVMLMAVMFGKKEIADMSDEGLIICVLLIQFIAIPGAQLFSMLSGKIGNIKALAIALFIWIGICISAFFTYTAVEFYVLAGVVGFVMGGVQSLSRSTYSKFLPETTDHASYFSFFDVLEKIGIVIGTFAWGYILGVTESMRNSIFMLSAFFIIGLVLIFFVPKNEVNSKTEFLSDEL